PAVPAIVARRITVPMPAVMPAVAITVMTIAVVMAIAVSRQRLFLVSGLRPEGAGATIGGPLVDVILLGGRLGEPLVAPARAASAARIVAVAIGRHVGLCTRADIACVAAAAAPTARCRRRNTRGRHGQSREQSLDHL